MKNKMSKTNQSHFDAQKSEMDENSKELKKKNAVRKKLALTNQAHFDAQKSTSDNPNKKLVNQHSENFGNMRGTVKQYRVTKQEPINKSGDNKYSRMAKEISDKDKKFRPNGDNTSANIFGGKITKTSTPIRKNKSSNPVFSGNAADMATDKELKTNNSKYQKRANSILGY